jgi:predicted O-methyltransferase YrrM
MPFTLLRENADRWNTQITGLKDFIRDNCTSSTVMVEVGSYAGESSALFAAAVKELICVDPWDQLPGMLYAKEAEEWFNRLTAPFLNVVKLKGFSEDVSRFFRPCIFDLVYIDANHDYDHVRADMLAWMPAIKAGGYIAGHDYYTTFPGVIQAVKELFGGPDKVYKDGSWVKTL